MSEHSNEEQEQETTNEETEPLAQRDEERGGITHGGAVQIGPWDAEKQKKDREEDENQE